MTTPLPSKGSTGTSELGTPGFSGSSSTHGIPETSNSQDLEHNTIDLDSSQFKQSQSQPQKYTNVKNTSEQATTKNTSTWTVLNQLSSLIVFWSIPFLVIPTLKMDNILLISFIITISFLLPIFIIILPKNNTPDPKSDSEKMFILKMKQQEKQNKKYKP